MGEIYKNLSDRIYNLQNTEKSLYRQKEQLVGKGLVDEQNRMINQIQDISQKRIAAYNNLDQGHKLMYEHINSNQDTLHKESMKSCNIEGFSQPPPVPLQMVANYNLNKEKNINLKRQIEIIEYSKKRNNSYSGILWWIIKVLIIIICITAISKQSYIPIPTIVTTSLLLVTLIIGIIRLIVLSVTLSYRDNMDFDKFVWPWWYPDGSGSQIDGDLAVGVEISDLGIGGVCFGSECCGTGTQYSSANGSCVPV